ncbi:MAG: 6-phosphogluconolactonase [Nocardioidaceae bacterium]
MTVLTSPDPAALATAVARRLLDRLAEVQAGGGIPHIALTGGTIADAIHREVARLSRGSAVDWSRVELWWGDERYVARADPDRNAGQARKALLDHVDVAADRVHEMPASDAGYPDVDAAAAAYGDEVRRDGAGRFDVVMLGVGPDGHVASLFPGFPQLDVDDRIAVGVTGSPKPPPERISLTFPTLERTRSVWFVVAGSGKAAAVARAVGGADPHEVPAARPHGAEETLWMVDAAAASGL